jgi:hypothetical protein
VNLLIDAFLAELAASIPALPNAACREHRDLFDSIVPSDIGRAVEICSGCVDLQPCARWADDQAPRTLTGVVAGVDRTYTFRYSREK